MSEFCERVAGRSPTPGGGAVAAVIAVMAAALLRMASAICLERVPEDGLKATIAEVEACETKLKGYADEDVQAFDAYIAARKKQEKDAQQALIDCALVPLNAAEEVAKLQRLAAAISERTPDFLASDVATVRHLLRAARQSLLANVTINCLKIENCEEKCALEERATSLLRDPNHA